MNSNKQTDSEINSEIEDAIKEAIPCTWKKCPDDVMYLITFVCSGCPSGLTSYPYCKVHKDYWLDYVSTGNCSTICRRCDYTTLARISYVRPI